MSERGEAAVERVRELTGGMGAHSVLECVGSDEAMTTRSASRGQAAPSVASAFRTMTATPASQPAFYRNIIVGGGPAPVRAYIEELLPDILEGRIEPGRVFDSVVGLEQVPAGYAAMDRRESIKVMVKP